MGVGGSGQSRTWTSRRCERTRPKSMGGRGEKEREREGIRARGGVGQGWGRRGDPWKRAILWGLWASFLSLGTSCRIKGPQQPLILLPKWLLTGGAVWTSSSSLCPQRPSAKALNGHRGCCAGLGRG